MEGATFRMKRKSFRLLLAAALLFLSVFYYLPFYVSKPGMAKELDSIVEVEGGYEEEGSFMLTTIRMGRANIYSYIYAKFSKYQEIYPLEAIRGENESDEDYTNRQLHLMDSSKSSAIEVAYKKAGKPVEYRENGIFVLQVVEGMPADGKLKPGDRILELDGQFFTKADEFIKYVGSKKAGDEVTLKIERDGKSMDIPLVLQTFKNEPGRAGIGVSPVEDRDIIVDPVVDVNSEEIGGPSAGFMFSLEIYNQLTEEDLTRGYEIAGTGTISSDGSVGRIGGIEQKIVAADNAGAEIFFAPNEEGAKNSNYRAAIKTAKDIGTDMKVVPVDNFDDAIKYLTELPEKTD